MSQTEFLISLLVVLIAIGLIPVAVHAFITWLDWR
jgi:hypothetical protein